MQEVPYEQSRIIPYATKIYSQEDPVHKVIRTAGDSGKHNDMDFLALHPVVYAAHLTIAGSGAVEASVASKLYNKNVFSNEGNPTHQREFGIGDLHLFVRQGAKRGNVLHAPSTHKFTSNLGGRAYVHGSFGVALEWQEYTSNGAKSQLQVPQSN